MDWRTHTEGILSKFAVKKEQVGETEELSAYYRYSVNRKGFRNGVQLISLISFKIFCQFLKNLSLFDFRFLDYTVLLFKINLRLMSANFSPLFIKFVVQMGQFYCETLENHFMLNFILWIIFETFQIKLKVSFCRN